MGPGCGTLFDSRGVCCMGIVTGTSLDPVSHHVIALRLTSCPYRRLVIDQFAGAGFVESRGTPKKKQIVFKKGFGVSGVLRDLT